MKNLFFTLLLSSCGLALHKEKQQFNIISVERQPLELFSDQCLPSFDFSLTIEPCYPVIYPHKKLLMEVPPLVTSNGLLIYVKSERLVAFDLLNKSEKWSANITEARTTQLLQSSDKLLLIQWGWATGLTTVYKTITGEPLFSMKIEKPFIVKANNTCMFLHLKDMIQCYDTKDLAMKFNLDFRTQLIEIQRTEADNDTLYLELKDTDSNQLYVASYDLKGTIKWKSFGSFAGSDQTKVFILKDWLSECWIVDKSSGTLIETVKLYDFNGDVILASDDQICYSSRQTYHYPEIAQVSSTGTNIKQQSQNYNQMLSLSIRTKTIRPLPYYNQTGHVDFRKIGNIFVLKSGDVKEGAIRYKNVQVYTQESLLFELNSNPGICSFILFEDLICVTHPDCTIKVYKLK